MLREKFKYCTYLAISKDIFVCYLKQHSWVFLLWLKINVSPFLLVYII